MRASITPDAALHAAPRDEAVWMLRLHRLGDGHEDKDTIAHRFGARPEWPIFQDQLKYCIEPYPARHHICESKNKFLLF
jgi:hypothetical protein